LRITRNDLRRIIIEEIERSLNEQGIDMPNIYHARHSGQWPKDVEEDFDKEQAELGRAFINNPVYDFVSIFDLTGIMSWPALMEAIVRLPDNPSKKDLAILAVCIIAIIPLIGRGTKFIKGYNLLSDLSRGVSKIDGQAKFLRKVQDLVLDFYHSSTSMTKVIDDILKKAGDDFILKPQARERLISAAKKIDDLQVIPWIHKKLYVLNNIKDVALKHSLQDTE